MDSPAQAKKTGSKIKKGRESGLKNAKRSAVGALENALLLALRLAGETFLTRIARFRTVADFLQPQRGDPAAAALNTLTLHRVARGTCRGSPAQKNHKGRDKYRPHHQPPKSSSMMFSSSTPVSLSIFNHRGVHHRRPAHIELAIFRRRMVAQIVFIQNIMDKARMPGPVIFRQRIGERDVEGKIGGFSRASCSNSSS